MKRSTRKVLKFVIIKRLYSFYIVLSALISHIFITFVALKRNYIRLMRHFTVFTFLFLLTLPLVCNAQRKRAFLVGISKYHANGRTAWTNIHGKEDVDLLTPVLIEKGFAVRTIVNEDATYQGITSALSDFIRETRAGDIVYLHFSCHGQPVEDGLKKDTIDEADHWDESIVPIDAGNKYLINGYKGEKHLTDDELNSYFIVLRKKIKTKGVLYVAMDACHAGNMEREGLEPSIRGTNEALTSNANTKYNPPKSNINHFPIKPGNNLAPTLFFEACRSDQRNTEIRIGGKEYGALSYNIVQALKSMTSFKRNAKEFEDNVKKSTAQPGHWHRTQTLVTESSF